MINWRIIWKIIGQLLVIEAGMMALCMLLSFLYQEDDTPAFFIAVVATIVGACVMHYAGRDSSNTMYRRDSFLVVTLVWVIFSFFGAIPFVASGYVPSPTDAFFETISGFTTTGASLIDDVERLPHALLFWRSLTQWVGGLGIVFFTVATLPSLVGGSVKVFSAEATGPMRVKMHPRLSTTGRWIWGIYSTLTLVCAACFYVEGMGLFDCINYAMTVTATGGFATHNSSTGYFHNPAIDYTAIAFMFLCGSSFTLLYTTLFKRKFREFFCNSEFRLYLGMVVVCTVAIMGVLMVRCDYGISDAFRSSLFQVVSFLTTTGVFNDDAGQWPHITWVVLSVCMFVGGCAGSTSGGFKCIRAVMLWEIVRNEFRRLLHPNAVLPVRVGSTTVSYSHQLSLFAFLVMYISLSLATYFIMIISDVDSTNAITIALSCASNVGPSLGLEIGPTMSWNVLPDLVKWLLSLLMLMGRLEILSVVVLFTPSFWRDK
ncbi:MAG: TrkH family potassium uptake protein [Bacteroidaceae bacterium]|nr:TrkH family potassium uptake protein [Bacteroidaceae bacterium]